MNEEPPKGGSFDPRFGTVSDGAGARRARRIGMTFALGATGRSLLPRRVNAKG
jgi:hypothetical protein